MEIRTGNESQYIAYAKKRTVYLLNEHFEFFIKPISVEWRFVCSDESHLHKVLSHYRIRFRRCLVRKSGSQNHISYYFYVI